jgi:hypothetical protein
MRLQRRLQRLLGWLGLPILVAVATGVVVYLASARSVHGPVLQCPGVLDLGEREFGSDLAIGVVFSNPGDEDLVVEDIRTNCSCNSLQSVKEGRATRVESLRLAPGEVADLTFRVTTRGRIGEPMANTVAFRTNDPRRPTGEIRANISVLTGRLVVTPTTGMFGNVRVGEQRRQEFEVFDPAVAPRPVTGVTSSDPEVFAARYFPAGGPASESALGVPVGRIEVVFKPKRLGKVSAVLKVDVGGDRPRQDEVRLTGETVADIDVSPRVVVLPRRSNGSSIYTIECKFESYAGGPLTLEVASSPEDVRAEVLAAVPGTAGATVRITALPAARPPLGSPPANRKVQYRARGEGIDLMGEIPIVIHSE